MTPLRRVISCDSTQRAGFSLIELLVVISIVALLISILLPALAASRDIAKSVACLSNQRQLGTASAVYLNDNDGYWWSYYRTENTTDKYYNIWWPAKLIKETAITSAEIYKCPSADYEFPVFESIDISDPLSAYHTHLAWSHYGYNLPYLGSSIRDLPTDPSRLWRTPRAADILSPSKTVAMLDSKRTDHERGYNIVYDYDHPTYRGFGRHTNAVNVLWADGHANSIRLEDNYDVYDALPGSSAPAGTINVWDRE